MVNRTVYTCGVVLTPIFKDRDSDIHIETDFNLAHTYIINHSKLSNMSLTIVSKIYVFDSYSQLRSVKIGIFVIYIKVNI